mmetsp:Transcript_56083/g.147490  ORF Transcript_56083/g.147490 Transcript_56083/m.147490 type:complete len:231 (-) Transcript_56083:2244-2936(-)
MPSPSSPRPRRPCSSGRSFPCRHTCSSRAARPFSAVPAQSPCGCERRAAVVRQCGAPAPRSSCPSCRRRWGRSSRRRQPLSALRSRRRQKRARRSRTTSVWATCSSSAAPAGSWRLEPRAACSATSCWWSSSLCASGKTPRRGIGTRPCGRPAGRRRSGGCARRRARGGRPAFTRPTCSCTSRRTAASSSWARSPRTRSSPAASRWSSGRAPGNFGPSATWSSWVRCWWR